MTKIYNFLFIIVLITKKPSQPYIYILSVLNRKIKIGKNYFFSNRKTKQILNKKK